VRQGVVQTFVIQLLFLGLTTDHAFPAGVAHAAYRKSGGRRQRILAGFFIGAHALHKANQLFTREQGFIAKTLRSFTFSLPLDIPSLKSKVPDTLL
jgi:predicted nucleic acid-binding protein